MLSLVLLVCCGLIKSVEIEKRCMLVALIQIAILIEIKKHPQMGHQFNNLRRTPPI